VAVLGGGKGHGAVSVLHALGAGYGCSIGIDLSTRVQLRDAPVKRKPEDSHGLLPAVVTAWQEAGLTMPEAEELFWAVRSDLPIGRGIKSSSALSIAAIHALMEATETELENHQKVDIAANAQLAAECSLTGSVDDNWASLEAGWKVVDPSQPAANGILLEGEVPDIDDWTVLVIDRGPRENPPDPERFQLAAQQFQLAIQAIEAGNLFNAMIQNGRAVATATGDALGRKVCNEVGVWGCRTATISGSGPAVVAVVPKGLDTTTNRVKQFMEKRDYTVTETKFYSE